jgi:DNA processing protein
MQETLKQNSELSQMISEEEKYFQIALTLIPMIGVKSAKHLIEVFGSAKEVFSTSNKSLARELNTGAKVEDFHKEEFFTIAEREIQFTNKNGIHILSFQEEAYPQRLLMYEDSPIILYKKGDADLNPNKALSVIGTRSPTYQGTYFTENLVEGLKESEITIVSGLAHGIDAVAHRSSMENSLPTIGIMGSGFGYLYPADHKPLARQIIQQGGALLTEFPSFTTPDRHNFPMRNRLIAGFCDALAVVETAKKGGSMITIEIALSYNKEIFAVPGKPMDKMSSGCNALIKNQKAYLLDSSEYLLEMMNWGKRKKATQKRIWADLDENESKVISMLNSHPEADLDYLCNHLEMEAGSLAVITLGLELKGVLKAIPGKKFHIL